MTTYKETPNQTQDANEEQTTTPTVNQTENLVNKMPAITPDSNPERPAPFCTFAPETHEQKVALYRAMTNASTRLSDLINQPLKVTNAYIEWVDVTHEDSGEIEMVPRVVLFGVNGESYTATSKGIYNSLYRIMMIFGAGGWTPPLDLVVKQVQKGDKRYYTLDIV